MHLVSNSHNDDTFASPYVLQGIRRKHESRLAGPCIDANQVIPIVGKHSILCFIDQFHSAGC